MTASHQHLGALHHSKLSSFSLRPSNAFITAQRPLRRRCRTKAAAPSQALLRALLPAAPPPPPPPVPTATAELFAASTIYTLAVGLLLVLLPRWRRTQQLMRSPLVVAPLAIVYGFLLWQSWSPDTFSLVLPGSWKEGLSNGWNPQFFPSLAGICTLFSRVATAASLWVHLLAINLFAARNAYLEGLEIGVPTWHSALLCLTLAPLGLLSHAVTKALWRWQT